MASSKRKRSDTQKGTNSAIDSVYDLDLNLSGPYMTDEGLRIQPDAPAVDFTMARHIEKLLDTLAEQGVALTGEDFDSAIARLVLARKLKQDQERADANSSLRDLTLQKEAVKKIHGVLVDGKAKPFGYNKYSESSTETLPDGSVSGTFRR